MADERKVLEKVNELVNNHCYNAAFKICREYSPQVRGLDSIMADMLDKFRLTGQGASMLEEKADREKDLALKEQLAEKAAGLFEKVGWYSQSIIIYGKLYVQLGKIEHQLKKEVLHSSLTDHVNSIEKRVNEHIEKYPKHLYEIDPEERIYDKIQMRAELAEAEKSFGIACGYYDELAEKALVKLVRYNQLGAKESEIQRLSNHLVDAYFRVGDCYVRAGMFGHADHFAIKKLIECKERKILKYERKDIESRHEEYKKKYHMIMSEGNIEAFGKKEAPTEVNGEKSEQDKSLDDIIERNF